MEYTTKWGSRSSRHCESSTYTAGPEGCDWSASFEDRDDDDPSLRVMEAGSGSVARTRPQPGNGSDGGHGAEHIRRLRSEKASRRTPWDEEEEDILDHIPSGDQGDRRGEPGAIPVPTAPETGATGVVEPWHPEASSISANINGPVVDGGGEGSATQRLPKLNELNYEPQWEPFPLECLPEAARQYATEASDAIGCDPAFVAAPILPVLAAAVGNSCRIQLKRSWSEPSTVWAGTVGPSGSAKSPALSAAIAPVVELEGKARSEGKGNPTRRRISDTTIEAAIATQYENPRGILLARDELAGWLGSFDRYARGEADMQSWIELYGGLPVVVDRKTGEQKTLCVDYPAVSVAGTIQPSILKDRFKAQHLLSGFGGRFLFVMPPVGARRWTDEDIDAKTEERYQDLVWNLYNLPYKAEKGPKMLGLSEGARECFRDFVNRNGDRIAILPDGPLRAAFVKIEAVAARIALILHLAENVHVGGGHEPPPISEEAMRRAVRLAEWFQGETARIYYTLGFDVQPCGSLDERRLAELPDEFGWREIAEVASVGQRAAFKILARLSDQGLVRKVGHGRYVATSSGFSLGSLGSMAGGDGKSEAPTRDAGAAKIAPPALCVAQAN